MAAVVVRQREVGRIDTSHVPGQVDHAVGAAERMRTLLPEFRFERRQESIEEVQEQAVGPFDQLALGIAHQGTEDNGRRAVGDRRGVDPLQRFRRLFHRADKRQGDRPEGDAFELA